MAVHREKVIRTAEKYVSKGRIESAIREYRRVLQDHPEDVNTLNRLGDLYARIERYDEAVDLFQQIAEGYADDGFFVKAIAIYKKIIKLDPTHLVVYERLADLYHKQGLINEARTQYQVLADYHLKHDDPGGAIDVYRQMVDLEPGNPSHHVKLAELYVDQDRVEEAMEEYATIAELMIEAGHPQDAAQVYRKALDVNAGDTGFITDAVMELKQADHVAEAARFLALAVERNPEARKVARLVGMEGEARQDEASDGEAIPEEATPEEGIAVEGEPATGPAPEPLEMPEELTPAQAGELEEGPETDLEADTDVVLDLDEEGPGLGSALEEAAEAVGAEMPEEPAGPAAALPEGGVEEAAIEEPPVEAEAAASEPEGAAGQEIELDLDEVFVLDLEDEEPSPSQVQPPPDMEGETGPARAWAREEVEGEEKEGERVEAAGEVSEPQEPPEALEVEPEPVAGSEDTAAGEETAVEVDEEALERTVADLQPPEVREPEAGELISEAEVLAKYGMADKAVSRLREALNLEPENLEAHEVLIQVYLEQGWSDRIPEVAHRLRELAEGHGDPRERWPRTRERLEQAGFELERGEVVEAPKRKKKRKDTVDRLLRSALGEMGFGRRKKKRKSRQQAPEEVSPEVPEETPGEAAAAPDASVFQPEEDDITLHGIFDEVELGDRAAGGPEAESAGGPELTPQPPVSQPDAPGEAGSREAPTRQPATSETPVSEEDPGTSWLDEVEETEALAAGGEEVLESEDDFFDLAGELEQELSAEEALGGEPLIQSQEQTLEEIVEGFKQGVAENLSPEDYDTHFNLGIAYREMGLLDEAIGEFQVAAKSRDHLVECCSMLGQSFLDKGLPELAVKWYRRGLSVPDLSEEESLGLLYDLGNVYLATDDHEAAQETFVELYGVNSNYRDVVAKLEELRQA